MSADSETSKAPPSPSPYTIQLLHSSRNSRTYLIRECDRLNQHPKSLVGQSYLEGGTDKRQPASWNLATFLEHTLNPGHAAPYIVITTHCHYDHICGIQHLIDASVDLTVLSSSHDKGFLTPWRNLQKHSLCSSVGLQAPHYDAHWVEDTQRVSYPDGESAKRVQSSITIIQTPGHTPDSLSWYDHDTYTLCVGDMFYERESDETRSGSGGEWEREPPMPVMFGRGSSIIDWNASMHRLLDFVRSENRRLGTENALQTGYRQDGQGTAVGYSERDSSEQTWSIVDIVPARRRVALCAAHVTVATDAEFALLDMLAFMLRIQLDQVPKRRTKSAEGLHDMWLWDESLAEKSTGGQVGTAQYSVQAPYSVIFPNSKPPPLEEGNPSAQAHVSDYRSMIRQVTVKGTKTSLSPSLKSAASASLSQNIALADRPTSASRKSAKPG